MRCDSHIHIVGDPAKYPQVTNRVYLAGLASLEDLERNGATRGVRRFVIVQPSFYGTDNSLLLDGLDALEGRGRGVAVVDPETITAQACKALTAHGVRGLRINLYSPLGSPAPLAQRFAALENIADAHGWHIEVIAAMKLLAGEAELLAKAKVPVVVDHYALYADEAPQDVTGRAFLDLLRLPHVWIKLSAPYRVSADTLALKAEPAWVAAFLDAAPSRCVWGSDWPHTPPHQAQGDSHAALPYRRLDYAAVVDGFLASTGDAALAERALTDNPARLYDFTT